MRHSAGRRGLAVRTLSPSHSRRACFSRSLHATTYATRPQCRSMYVLLSSPFGLSSLLPALSRTGLAQWLPALPACMARMAASVSRHGQTSRRNENSGRCCLLMRSCVWPVCRRAVHHPLLAGRRRRCRWRVPRAPLRQEWEVTRAPLRQAREVTGPSPSPQCRRRYCLFRLLVAWRRSRPYPLLQQPPG